ncbi:MAG: ROK family protein [Spirochaetales bacterium]|nr:ROK family protein [Spirochaetales bacterium]
MKQKQRYFCGVDFGGTSAKIGIVDEQGKLYGTERLAISAGQSYEDIFGMVAHCIRRRSRQLGANLTAIGVGSPGFIDRTEGRVIQGSENLPAFKNRSLVKYLHEDFLLPVFADNDANCAAAGELQFGVGVGYDSFVMITLGAGVGGALVLEGRVFRGTRGLAGEIGHICLDAHGPFCTCGSRGCFEQYANAAAIERSYREKIEKRRGTPGTGARGTGAPGRRGSGRSVSGGKVSDSPANGGSISAESVFLRSRSGDPLAGEVVRETAWHIARVFGSLVNIFNPQACIIGGGISAAGEQLLQPVQEYIADFAWPLPLEGVKIHSAELHNDAGVLGAAAQCLDRLKS